MIVIRMCREPLFSKVDEEVTNRLKDEIKTNYGAKIDSSTNQNVDNLQIRVSIKCLLCAPSQAVDFWSLPPWKLTFVHLFQFPVHSFAIYTSDFLTSGYSFPVLNANVISKQRC